MYVSYDFQNKLFPQTASQIGFGNEELVYFPWGRNWMFKYYLEKLQELEG
jgi:hypothetical protein